MSSGMRFRADRAASLMHPRVPCAQEAPHEERCTTEAGRIAELGWEPSLDAAQIGVEVQGGVVTLAGSVDSYSEQWHAERATRRQ